MVTTADNYFDIGLLDDAFKAVLPRMKALFGSSAVIARPGMPGNVVGQTVYVPKFDLLGDAETVADGASLTLKNHGSGSDSATVVRVGQAVQMTDLAAAVGSYSQPGEAYLDMSQQMLDAATKAMDDALITAASATNAAMTINKYSATVPRTLDFDLVVDGRALWGDEDNEVALICVHSKVKRDLKKLKDAAGRPLMIDPKGPGELPTIDGIPVATSDRLPTATMTNGSVTAGGTSPPTLTPGGTATYPAEVKVICTLAGARGTAKIKYSLDGGANYYPEEVTAATITLPNAATMGFANNTFSLDNEYTYSITAAQYTSLLVKPGALALWYNAEALIEQQRDVRSASTIFAWNLFFIAHRYARARGTTKSGIVILKHNITT